MDGTKRHLSGKGTMTKRVFVMVVGLGSLAALLSFGPIARADGPPDEQDVQFAQRTSDLMLNTVLAALLQEFAETTQANAEEGKKSISLIFNDRNEDMRLVGALQPLRVNDAPQDWFEGWRSTLRCRGSPTQTRRGFTGSGTTGDRSRSATSIRPARCATRTSAPLTRRSGWAR